MVCCTFGDSRKMKVTWMKKQRFHLVVVFSLIPLVVLELTSVLHHFSI